MLLQPRKLIPKSPPTPPTPQLPIQIMHFPRIPPLVPFLQRKIIHIYQERRRETIVMFSMSHALIVPIDGEDVNVKMIHRGAHVDT